MNTISPTPTASRSRAADLNSAMLLTYVTLGRMTIEGRVSLVLGLFSQRLLLLGLGIDSIIEMSSAILLFWRSRIER